MMRINTDAEKNETKRNEATSPPTFADKVNSRFVNNNILGMILDIINTSLLQVPEAEIIWH